MPAVVRHRIRTSQGRRRALAALALLVAASVATEGCSMIRRRAAERPPYRKVSPPIAYEIMRDTPNLLILDMRPQSAFHGDTGHIYRAYNVPEEQLPYRLFELSQFREETFLVYCDTAKCGDEGMAVLTSSGFENAILIDGGIDAWIAKGFRTVLPAELAGKRQRASQEAKPGEAASREQRDERESPPVLPALHQESTAPAPPALCTEPHVSVQKPPR